LRKYYWKKQPLSLPKPFLDRLCAAFKMGALNIIGLEPQRLSEDMKKILTTIACMLPLGMTSLIAQEPAAPVAPAAAAEPAKPLNMDDVSYSIGVDIGGNLKRNNVEANLDELLAGIKASIAGGDLRMTETEMRDLMMAFQTKMREDRVKLDAEAADKNLKDAEAFLADNAKKDGVKTTDSGLQYEVITEGTGPQPLPSDKVKAIYKGTLADGTVFDDSRGEPREFPLNRVVKGWQEALPMMKTGGKWKLYVPPALGYGERRQGAVIEPNSLLVFEIELVEISKPVAAVTPAVRAPIPTNPDGTPKKRITAVTPPVSVPIRPKTEVTTDGPAADAPKPAEEKKAGE
jgi:FKBP-type peptidyl-prolyl cis-trans isomerase FklB